MNYNHLHYFHVIAQEGSIAGAARRLNVSQPTLSEQLKQIEGYFSTKLFDRKSGAMRLNSNGRRALKFTEAIFDQADRLEASFKQAPGPAKIRLDIGVVTTCSRSVMTDRLVQLFRDESVIVRVRQGDNQYLLHELVSNGLDILLTDSIPPQAAERGIEIRELASPRLVVIADKKHKPSPKADLRSTLNGQPFIHYTSQSQYRWEIDQYFREIHTEPSIVAEADDVYVIREAVKMGIGFGVVPKSMLHETHMSEGIEIIGELDRNFEIYALFSKKDPTEETVKALAILTAL